MDIFQQRMLDEAIKNKHIISFNYENHFRLVEPHHYGILGEDTQLHGYQIGGESATGSLPEWRNFKLNQMLNLAIVKESYFNKRASYNPSNAHFKHIIRAIKD